MSRRFGRAQKRKAREEIAKLKADLAIMGAEVMKTRIHAVTAESTLRHIHHEIEKTIDKHSILLPIKTQERRYVPEELALDRVSFGDPAPYGEAQEISGRVSHEILKLIRIRVVADELKHHLHVRVSDGKKESGVLISYEDLWYGHAQRAVIEEAVMRTIDALQFQLK